MAELRPATILYIDDEETNRYAIRRVLERQGYQVLEAQTGSQGLELAASSDPDLIILDVRLPDINGFEVCRRLKADPILSVVPVLQISANFTRGHDHMTGVESGADGYLTQPLETNILIATVRALLRIRRAEREREKLLESERRARAEAELERGKLHSLFTQTPAAICVLRGSRLTYELANAPYRELLNRSGQITGLSIHEFCPDEGGALARLAESVFRTGQAASARELSIPGKAENMVAALKTRYFNFDFEALRDVQDEVEGIVGVGYDVTDQVKARLAIERSSSILSRLHNITGALSSTVTAFEVANAILSTALQDIGAHHGCVVLANPDTGMPSFTHGDLTIDSLASFKETITFARNRLEWQKLWPSTFGEALRLGCQAFISLPLKFERRLLGSLTFAFEDTRAFGPDEKVFFEALTTQCAHALERARLFKDLQDALASRDEFLSIASHELKTPITALKLNLDMTKRSVCPSANIVPTPDKLARVLNTSSRQVDRLTGLVDDLLDVARIQSGRLTFNFENTDLSALVQDVVERLSSPLAEAGCQPELYLDPGVKGCWDHFRIEQVILNLVTNAMKYAAGQPVQIFVSGDQEKARLVVQDFGPGIPIERHDRIFDRFERATSSRNISGLGLGLFIVKKIIDAHHGAICVESAPNQGAKFIVELPLALPSEAVS